MANEDASSSLRIPLIACGAVLLLALLAVVGWTALLSWNEKGLDEFFEAGFETVGDVHEHLTLRRAATLEATRDSFTQRLAASGDLGAAKASAARAPKLLPCPPAAVLPTEPKGFLPWQVSRRLQEKQVALEKLLARVGCVVAVEDHLPALEREVAALEAHLRQLESRSAAAPVASTP